MTRVHGTIRDGGVVLDAPVGAPDGTRVVVGLAAADADVGLPEDEWDDSPEGIAAWLRWYDALQPPLFTPEEEAAWRRERADQKAFELSTWDDRGRKLEKLFE